MAVHYCTILAGRKAQDRTLGECLMSVPELDEMEWQGWLDRNAKQDREFFLKVKACGAVSLVLAVALLLWRLF